MLAMENQSKPLWKRPGVVAFVAAVVLVNFIADVWLFKPENVITFLIGDAVVVGGLVLVAIRRRPPNDGGGQAGSGDVANLVP
ncbi:MAG: hypothetical protein ACXVZZ_11370 [Terriglobales bacterium]